MRRAWRIAAGIILSALAGSGSRALDPARAITQYGHEVWMTDQGLPQNSVQAILQTRDGYMWIATQEGVARFDGVRFTVFDKTNVPGMRMNTVSSLFEDSDGSLLIGTDGSGVIRWKGGIFTSFTSADGLSSDRVLCLLRDRSGVLWVGTQGGGLNRVKDGKVAGFKKESGFPSDVVWALCEGPDGSVWCATGGGLVRFQGENRTVLMKTDGLSDDNVLSVRAEPSGTIWAGTWIGLNRIEGDKIKVYTTRDGLCHDTVTSLCWSGHGTLWIGTYGGLNRLRGGRMESYTQRDGLSHDSVWSIAGDTEGSLWVGTLGGLNRFRDTKFLSFGRQEGLPDDDLWAILEARDGSLYLGSNQGGLVRLKGGRLTCFRKGEGLPSDTVTSLAQDSEGVIWAAVEGGSTALVRLRGDRPELFQPKGQDLRETSISALIPARGGGLWIGCTRGLGRLQKDELRLWGRKEGLTRNTVNCLLEEPGGGVWAGTDGGGLALFKDGKFEVFHRGDGLASEVIYSLHLDDGGALWVGTNAGLHRLKDGKFTVFTTKSGLFDDTAFGILEDDRGDLWMSCNKGVYRASQRELEAFARGSIKTVPCTAFGKADGLKTNECNGATQPCVWKGMDGRLYFATARGFGVIDPAVIRTNSTPPPVVIERVLADGSPLLDAKLDPGRHRLDFEYTGLSLIAPEKILFKYRLIGLETDWVDAGTKREAAYTALPPGVYTFQVIACNNDGVWNEKGASFRFEIAPRLYQTKRFIVVCILLGAVAVGAGVHLRTRRLLGRQRELEREVAVRTAQLAAANEELQRLTQVDVLTGAASRRHLYELLETEWRRGRRAGDPVSLLMADIDLFKAYNDAFGHPAGDECLKKVAAVLSNSLHRSSDVVGRYGGEEFLVVLPATDGTGARQVAEAMRSGVEALAIPSADTRISQVVTLSVGVATAVPGEDSVASDLVEEADRALYRAKQSGRNRVVAAEDGPRAAP